MIHFNKLLQYEIWANDKMIAAIQACQPEDDKLNQLMSHILAARVVWLERIQGKLLTNAIWEIQSLEKCIKLHEDINVQYTDFIKSLENKDLDKIVSYKNLKEDDFLTSLSDILVHVFNHSTYHRGQITNRLKALSLDIQPTDYIVFSRLFS